MARVTVDVELDAFTDDEILDAAAGILRQDADTREEFLEEFDVDPDYGSLSDMLECAAEQLNALGSDKREAVFDAMRNCECARIGLLVD